MIVFVYKCSTLDTKYEKGNFNVKIFTKTKGQEIE